jgi:transcriptional regulator with XRE-family HTH domain
MRDIYTASRDLSGRPANVKTSLAANRKGHGAMSNERLRTQIAAAGLTVQDLARRVEVDPKTIERWVTKDRLPHRRHRWTTSHLLDVDEGYLWPQVLDDPQTQSATQAEFVTLYPHRGSIPSDLWTSLIDSATDSIDVLVYAGLFLLDGQPDLLSKLEAKAEEGTKTRLLLGEPGSTAIEERAEQEGIGSAMAARINLSLDALKPILGVPGIELRLHTTTLYNSIYRFDQHLLVNTHVYGAPAPHNPVMHLRRVPGGRLFDHYIGSFDRVWATGTEITSRP